VWRQSISLSSSRGPRTPWHTCLSSARLRSSFYRLECFCCSCPVPTIAGSDRRLRGARQVRWGRSDNRKRRRAMRLSLKAIGTGAVLLVVLVSRYAQEDSRPAGQDGKDAARSAPPNRQLRRSGMTAKMRRRDPNAPPWRPGPIPETIPIRVSGVARDEAGKAVAGATVILSTITERGSKPAGRATTDSKGRYDLGEATLPVSRIDTRTGQTRKDLMKATNARPRSARRGPRRLDVLQGRAESHRSVLENVVSLLPARDAGKIPEQLPRQSVVPGHAVVAPGHGTPSSRSNVCVQRS